MKVPIKKYGDEFFWVEAEDVQIGGKTLATIFAEHKSETDALNAEVKLLNDRITRFVEIFAGGTVK